MNWVGGARSRIKRNTEEKKQREFFKRKRMEASKDVRSVKSSNTPALSKDLLIFNFLQIKSKRSRVTPKPTQVIKQDLEKINSNKTTFIDIPETPVDSLSSAHKHQDNSNRRRNKDNSTVFQSDSSLCNHINKEFNNRSDNTGKKENSASCERLPPPSFIKNESKMLNHFNYEPDLTHVNEQHTYQETEAKPCVYQTQKDYQSMYMCNNSDFSEIFSSRGKQKFKNYNMKNINPEDSSHETKFSSSVQYSNSDLFGGLGENSSITNMLSEAFRKPIINTSDCDFNFQPSPVIKNKYLSGNYEDFSHNDIKFNSMFTHEVDSSLNDIEIQDFENFSVDTTDSALSASPAYLHSNDFLNLPTENISPFPSTVVNPERTLKRSEITEDIQIKHLSHQFDITKNIMKSILKPPKALKSRSLRNDTRNIGSFSNKIYMNTYENGNNPELREKFPEKVCDEKNNLKEQLEYSVFQQMFCSNKKSEKTFISHGSRQNGLPIYSDIYNTRNASDVRNRTQKLLGSKFSYASRKILLDNEANFLDREYFTDHMKRNHFADMDSKQKIYMEAKNKRDMATSPALPNFLDSTGKEGIYDKDPVFYNGKNKNKNSTKLATSTMTKTENLETGHEFKNNSLRYSPEIYNDKAFSIHKKELSKTKNIIEDPKLYSPEITRQQYIAVNDIYLSNLPPTVPNSPSVLNYTIHKESEKEYNGLNGNRNRHNASPIQVSQTISQSKSYNKDVPLPLFSDLVEHKRNESINLSHKSEVMKFQRNVSKGMKAKSSEEKDFMNTSFLASSASNATEERKAETKCSGIDINKNEQAILKSLSGSSFHLSTQRAEVNIVSNITAPSNFMSNEFIGIKDNECIITTVTEPVSLYKHSESTKSQITEDKETCIISSGSHSKCEPAKPYASNIEKGEELDVIPVNTIDCKESPEVLHNTPSFVSEGEYLSSKNSESNVLEDNCSEIPLPKKTTDVTNVVQDISYQCTEIHDSEKECSEISLLKDSVDATDDKKISNEIKINTEAVYSASEDVNIIPESPEQVDIIRQSNNILENGTSSTNQSEREDKFQIIERNVSSGSFQSDESSRRYQNNMARIIFVDTGTQTCNDNADFSCQVNI